MDKVHWEFWNAEPLRTLLGPELVSEASLSRVFRHIDKKEGFALLTAWRGDKTNKVNQANQKKLGTLIRSLGYG